jgi:hypothetical protein
MFTSKYFKRMRYVPVLTGMSTIYFIIRRDRVNSILEFLQTASARYSRHRTRKYIRSEISVRYDTLARVHVTCRNKLQM